VTAIQPSDSADPSDDLLVPWAQWFAAAAEESVDTALRCLFDRLEQEVRGKGLVCDRSGRCCHFDEFGHRLYATALEIAWLLTQVERTQLPPPALGPPETPAPAPGSTPGIVPATDQRVYPTEIDPAGPCVFQVDGLCTVHAFRPVGCRVFFCDKTTDDWQHDLCERFLAELRQVHREHTVAYQYMEWRCGLAQAVGSP